jgi:hypothetical protein
MISIERCKEILGEDMPDSEVERLRESLYTMVESILDNYFEEFATIDTCKKQLFTAEYPLPDKALKDTDLIVKNIAVESMPHRRAMMS